MKHCAFRFSRTCSLLSSPKSVLDGPDPNQDRSLNQVVGPWSWTNWGFLRTQLDSRWCLRSLPCPPLLELSCQIRAPHRNNGDSLGIIPTPQNTKDLSRDSVRVNSKITFSLQSLLLFRINMFQQKKEKLKFQMKSETERKKILDQIKEKNIPNSSLYQEFIIEYQLLAEYRLLQKNGPHNGVYIIPSSKSALIWFGVIFVRSGPYMNGIFKFRIHIPHDYPGKNSNSNSRVHVLMRSMDSYLILCSNSNQQMNQLPCLCLIPQFFIPKSN